MKAGQSTNSSTAAGASMADLQQAERPPTVEPDSAHPLHELSTRLIRGGDIQTLYHQMIDTAVAIMHSDCASMQVLGERSSDLHLLAWRGFDQRSAQYWQRITLESISSRAAAARRGERVFITDTEQCETIAGTRDLEEYRRSHIRSTQSTPLLSRTGRLLGMISTHWRRPHQPAAGELRTFDILVRQCADLIERRQTEEALRAADRHKDEFLATLAHELRNPLAPLRSGLAVMKLAADQPHLVAEMRSMMERQVDQLVRLIDDLLDVNRITLGKIELHRARVELAGLLRQAVETFPVLLEQRRFELLLPAEPLHLDGDGARLTQVFSNLLHNALKFSEPQDRIRLCLTCDGGEALISISDEGIGIPPEKLDEVFGMFTQLHTEPARTRSGLGIGLALARQLVQLHGGSVRAHSRGPGHGAEFIVRLPLIGPAAAASAAALERIAPVRSGGVVGTVKRRVLVVDDNRDAVLTLRMLLELEGGQIECAYDGTDALDKGRAFRPELILLDIGMPGIDGYDTCNAIRREPWGRDATIIALTGWGQQADRERASQAGFDAHLVKPVDPATLATLLAGIPANAAPSSSHSSRS
ncbi:MAG TPA: ATP-binding protein [Steroidobacteraceae bacterium]|jgi:signal transduction histidine kinase/ActR/RegA family two-component response regulator|nr:ATP-binding protein [Steroidobacteraceae bacterium]